jgi:hypothetical protein
MASISLSFLAPSLSLSLTLTHYKTSKVYDLANSENFPLLLLFSLSCWRLQNHTQGRGVRVNAMASISLSFFLSFFLSLSLSLSLFLTVVVGENLAQFEIGAVPFRRYKTNSPHTCINLII